MSRHIEHVEAHDPIGGVEDVEAVAAESVGRFEEPLDGDAGNTGGPVWQKRPLDSCGRVDVATQLFVGAPQLALDTPPFGHVPDGRDYQRTFIGLDRTEADVYRKLPATLVKAFQVGAGRHRAGRARLLVGAAMLPVPGSRMLGYQYLDRPADDLRAIEPEHVLDQVVRVHDGAGAIDGHDSIRYRLQKRERRSRPVAVGHGTRQDAEHDSMWLLGN